MSKAVSSFRRTDVKRAIQAFKSAGVNIGRIELERDKITIFPNTDEPAEDRPNSFG
jgi:hypothetical protein